MKRRLLAVLGIVSIIMFAFVVEDIRKEHRIKGKKNKSDSIKVEKSKEEDTPIKIESQEKQYIGISKKLKTNQINVSGEKEKKNSLIFKKNDLLKKENIESIENNGIIEVNNDLNKEKLEVMLLAKEVIEKPSYIKIENQENLIKKELSNDLETEIFLQQDEIEDEKKIVNLDILKKVKQDSDIQKKEKKEISDKVNIFFVEQVKINNLILLKAEVFKIKKKYEQINFSNDNLQSLVKELNNLYLENGYVTTRVKVKIPQDLKTGVLELDVINGYIEEIIQNKNTLRNKLSVLSAFPMMKNEILNLKDIEQGIKQINGLNSNSAKMKIIPGEKYETSKIEITTEKSKPYNLNLTYDNIGEKSTGINRGTIGVGINDLLGINDSIYLSYKSTLEGEKDRYLNEYSGNYSFPLGYYKFSVNLSNSKTLTTVDGNTKKIEYIGETQKNKYEVKRDIFNEKNGNGYVKTALEFVKGRNYVEDVELSQSKKDLRIGTIEVGRTYKYEKGYLSSSLSYDKGLNIFNGTDDNKAKFNKYMINLSGTNAFNYLKKDFYYEYQLSGQYSKDIMYSSEKISAGDLYTVRGFQENSISGEQGLYLKNTLTYKIKSKKEILNNSQVFLGIDVGLTKDLSYESNSKYDEIEKISGISLGYQYNKKNINLDLTLAKPIIQPDYFSEEKYNIYLTSTISY